MCCSPRANSAGRRRFSDPAANALERTGYSWGPLSLMLLATALAQQSNIPGSAKALRRAETRQGTKSALFSTRARCGARLVPGGRAGQHRRDHGGARGGTDGASAPGSRRWRCAPSTTRCASATFARWIRCARLADEIDCASAISSSAMRERWPPVTARRVDSGGGRIRGGRDARGGRRRRGAGAAGSMPARYIVVLNRDGCRVGTVTMTLQRLKSARGVGGTMRFRLSRSAGLVAARLLIAALTTDALVRRRPARRRVTGPAVSRSATPEVADRRRRARGRAARAQPGVQGAAVHALGRRVRRRRRGFPCRQRV